MPRDLPPGIEQTRFGFRAYVCVTHAKTRHRTSRCFPPDTPLETIQGWRVSARAHLERQLAGASPVQASGFAADCDRYLAAVQALPTYKERRRHIQEWAGIFGERDRSAISASEIRTQRDRWLTVGPKCVQEKDSDGKVRWVEKPLPLSASAVNHRLRALENLWTVLDGRHAHNPVRDIPEAPTPDVAPRAIPYPLIAAILDGMGDTASKARLSVIAYVGLSHAQLMRVQPDDIDLRAKTLFLRPRQKGHVGRDRRGVTIPLSPKGVRAFRQIMRLDCWGRFSASALRKAFKRACAALNLPDTLTPYQLRHSFGTAVYAASGDLYATGVLLGHRDQRTTTRYTLGALDPRLAAAIAALRRRRSPTPYPTGAKASTSVRLRRRVDRENS